MFDLIANLLSFFYDINSSYVVAIVLLTLVVLVISTPLTLAGTRSMLKMQLMQPQLKEIQAKYDKDQREEMNAEMMAFYQENNINPVGGCLPMFFQIPVFLVLYRVILGVTRRATETGSFVGQVVGGFSSGNIPENVDGSQLQPFNPAYISTDSAMYADLTKVGEDGQLVNTMDSFGFDLARSASQVLGDGIVPAAPYLLLILVVFVSGWYQHQMIRKRQTGAPVNPTQEMIMKFMPFFLPVFAFTLPAAIVFYFLISNLYRIAQQYYITRSMYHGEDSLGAQLREQRESPQDGDGGKKATQDKKKAANNAAAKKKNAGQRHQGAGKNGGKSGRHKAASSNGTSGSSKSASAGKSTKSTKSTTSSSAARKTSSPGRNNSGREASARANVQPKARKKKR